MKTIKTYYVLLSVAQVRSHKIAKEYMKNPATTEARSEIMRKVGRKDTGPEMILRRQLHSRGFRYRLNDKSLPGSPDIVLPKYKSVIFVHGCFWHRHNGCRLASTPKDNAEFWNHKFNTNIERDARNEQKLIESGWNVITVWQCELKKSVIDKTLETVVNDLITK